jgi:hypothetical protein
MRERRTHPGSPEDCPIPSGHKSRAQSALCDLVAPGPRARVAVGHQFAKGLNDAVIPDLSHPARFPFRRHDPRRADQPMADRGASFPAEVPKSRTVAPARKVRHRESRP